MKNASPQAGVSIGASVTRDEFSEDRGAV